MPPQPARAAWDGRGVMRSSIRPWLIVSLWLAACGDGGGDAPIDAPRDALTDALVDTSPGDRPDFIDARVIDAMPGAPIDDVEPPDCGGDPLIARGGDLAMVVSALAIPSLLDSADLDGDGTPDNKLAGISALVPGPIADGLADGSLTLAVELFDRGGDPDACLKLALYRGACVGVSCSYVDAVPDVISLDPASIGAGGEPHSRLRAMATTADGQITTGVGVVTITLPVIDGAGLPLPLTVLSGGGALVGAGPTARLQDLRLYGVLQPGPLDALPSPPIEQIGATPDDSVLDLMYANLFAPLLALPTVPSVAGCRAADVDVDGDGLEGFCDEDTSDDLKRVTLCVDGDGTQIRDGDDGVPRCTDAMVGGVRRFRDGISAAFVLSTRPATIAP